MSHFKSHEFCLTGSMPVRPEQFQTEIYSEYVQLGGWPIDATHAIPMGGIKTFPFITTGDTLEIVCTQREGYTQ